MDTIKIQFVKIGVQYLHERNEIQKICKNEILWHFKLLNLEIESKNILGICKRDIIK